MRRSPSGTPSSVRTLFPTAFLAGIAQEVFGCPSTSTRHAPHCPWGEQPSFGDVIPAPSRRSSRSDAWSGTSKARAAPLSVSSTCTRSLHSTCQDNGCLLYTSDAADDLL